MARLTTPRVAYARRRVGLARNWPSRASGFYSCSSPAVGRGRRYPAGEHDAGIARPLSPVTGTRDGDMPRPGCSHPEQAEPRSPCRRCWTSIPSRSTAPITSLSTAGRVSVGRRSHDDRNPAQIDRAPKATTLAFWNAYLRAEARKIVHGSRAAHATRSVHALDSWQSK